jgi:glycosyltransferase involved in cell wall biosynthesis
MKKLLFIVNVDWFFISHRLPIAISAIKEGYEVHILTKVTSQLDVLERSGIIVHNAKLSRKKSGFYLLTELFEIFSNIKKIKPDIVHLVTIKPLLLGGLASRILRVPAVVSAIAGLGVVYTSDGFLSKVRRKLISTIYYIALSHKNQKVIFQNIDDHNRLVSTNNKLAEKSLLIPGSGVNLSLYSVKDKDKDKAIPIVMFAGRLLESKGVKEFVQAAELVNKNSLQARFILVGDIDPLHPESITELDLDQWKKDRYIEIWGYKSDMYNVIPLASVIVFPSYYGEGLPKILIEAAACGRAVITTDHPGCRDAIDPNITGLLVPVKDAQTLADSIENLISNPEKCTKMGEAGRQLAEEKFDVRYVTERHISIFKDLLKTI